MTPKLSICIPTYNRGIFIGETLESVISQATEDVEIVISDNASNDNTESIVQYYTKRFPQITFFKWEQNMGADKNYFKVVDLAKGDYCWLLGSDDCIKPGAIKRILNEIENNYEILLCNRTECDYKLRPIRDRRYLSSFIGDRVFDFSNKKELLEYLNNSASIGALFSYLSSIIFRRANWNEQIFDKDLMNTAYSHVFMLFSFCNQRCKLKYIKNSLVFCRGDNDSFMDSGIVARFLLDFNGYLLLADKLFIDGEVRKAFLKVMTREHSYLEIIKIKYIYNKTGLSNKVDNILLRFGYKQKMLALCDRISKHKRVISASIYLKKILTNINGDYKRFDTN